MLYNSWLIGPVRKLRRKWSVLKIAQKLNLRAKNNQISLWLFLNALRLRLKLGCKGSNGVSDGERKSFFNVSIRCCAKFGNLSWSFDSKFQVEDFVEEEALNELKFASKREREHKKNLKKRERVPKCEKWVSRRERLSKFSLRFSQDAVAYLFGPKKTTRTQPFLCKIFKKCDAKKLSCCRFYALRNMVNPKSAPLEHYGAGACIEGIGYHVEDV